MDVKIIRLTKHARERCAHRLVTEEEVCRAVREGQAEVAKKGRAKYRLTLLFDSIFQGKHYQYRQIAPIVAESPDEQVVVTVYVYYF